MIHDRFTCKLRIKTTAAYKYANKYANKYENKQLRLWFLLFVRDFVVFDIHL